MNSFREKVTEILASPLSRDEKLRSLAQLLKQEGNFHWVGLYSVSPTQISAIAWTGESPPTHPTFPISKGINGAAVAERRPVVVQDVTKDSRYLTTFAETRSEAVFPIISEDGAVIGTIDVESD